MYSDVIRCIQVQQREKKETTARGSPPCDGPPHRLRAHEEFRFQFLHREQIIFSCPVLSDGAAQHRADHTGVSECREVPRLGLLRTIRDKYN